MEIRIESPSRCLDYELIDAGGYKKLERFGEFILSRPEPQAIWDAKLSDKEWDSLVNAVFKKEHKSEEKGMWVSKKGMPATWFIPYAGAGDLQLNFRLGLSSFKHVGLFPEQAVNWEYIYSKVKKIGTGCKVLNLFAYTGGASLAARAAGADVTHVDSVKQVVSWSRENMEASKLKDIRWVVEDALKFVQREARRGNTYHGIILDPPAYGRGPKGEKWIIEEDLNELLKCCSQILNTQSHFLILNLYSIGFSFLIQESLLQTIFKKIENPEMGELYVEDRSNRKLPLGTFYRFSSL